jgi:hypothetical protein
MRWITIAFSGWAAEFLFLSPIRLQQRVHPLQRQPRKFCNNQSGECHGQWFRSESLPRHTGQSLLVRNCATRRFIITLWVVAKVRGRIFGHR